MKHVIMECVCAVPVSKAASTNAAVCLYDEPEEMRVEAWRIMGTEQDPKGHEFPYNSCVDDYAVPKRPQRAFPDPRTSPQRPEAAWNKETEQVTDRGLEEEPEEGMPAGPQDKDSPYNNLPPKMEDRL